MAGCLSRAKIGLPPICEDLWPDVKRGSSEGATENPPWSNIQCFHNSAVRSMAACLVKPASCARSATIFASKLRHRVFTIEPFRRHFFRCGEDLSQKRKASRSVASVSAKSTGGLLVPILNSPRLAGTSHRRYLLVTLVVLLGFTSCATTCPPGSSACGTGMNGSEGVRAN